MKYYPHLIYSNSYRLWETFIVLFLIINVIYEIYVWLTLMCICLLILFIHFIIIIFILCYKNLLKTPGLKDQQQTASDNRMLIITAMTPILLMLNFIVTPSSALIFRNYWRHFGAAAALMTLNEWQAKNCLMHKRFDKIPKIFERSPCP